MWRGLIRELRNHRITFRVGTETRKLPSALHNVVPCSAQGWIEQILGSEAKRQVAVAIIIQPVDSAMGTPGTLGRVPPAIFAINQQVE